MLEAAGWSQLIVTRADEVDARQGLAYAVACSVGCSLAVAQRNCLMEDRARSGMTATEEILNRLNPAVDGLDAAETQAAGAADHADDVRNKALAYGWVGIADGMQEVID